MTTSATAARGPGETDSASVDVRFFAAAKQSAGTASARWSVANDDTIGAVLARHGLANDPVIRRSSFLRNGSQATISDPLLPGDTLDVLPPFAGG